MSINGVNNLEEKRMWKYVTWGLLGLIILVGVSLAISIFFFIPRSSGIFYPVLPFFPLHFGLLGGIFLLFIVFWIARWLFWPWREHHPRAHSENHREAQDILKERYVKGEITREQFEQIMKDLKQQD